MGNLPTHSADEANNQALTGWRFPGWRMVTVAFFVDFVAVGFFFYSYSVFFSAISVEFGGSRLGAALGLTVTSVVGAVAAPLIGRALDRYPTKVVIAAGALAMTAGFFWLGHVQSQMAFYLVLGAFIGIGASSMGGLATAKLVASWFDRRRGMALGIAATGISLSGVIMPAVAAWLIQLAGWRAAFLVYSAITGILVLPLVLRWVVSRPEDLGLRADGALPELSNGIAVADTPRRWSSRGLLRDRNFWALSVTIGLLFCCSSTTLTHMVARVMDLGFSIMEAAPMVSICAAAGVFGKMYFGWKGDSMAPRNALWGTLGAQVVGQLIMMFSSDYAVLAVGAAIFGFGMGGVVPLQGAIVGALFGREQFGRVLGLMRPAMLPLQIGGVPFADWVYDVYGSYLPAFVLLLVLYAVASCVVALLPATHSDNVTVASRAESESAL